MINICQRDKFNLPEDITYLNCAYMGPSLNASQEAGRQRILHSSRPYLIKEKDFFDPITQLRSSFAQLTRCQDPERIAVNNAVSYGMANVIKQIRPISGSNIVMPHSQFPSNVHSWRRLCNEYNCELRIVKAPDNQLYRAQEWNEAMVDTIDNNTCALAVSPVHWSGGTVFDLIQLREQCRIHNTLFIVDGSQSIGAFPFSINELMPDALVCAGYKWLLGPYGLSFAYYGEFFDEGVPIEENWISHKECHDIKSLVNCHPDLLSKGLRYSSGQHPSFIYVSMLQAALDQLIEWKPLHVNNYCKSLHSQLLEEINSINNIKLIRDEKYFSPHLFGIWFEENTDLRKLKAQLEEYNIYISQRGDAMRISINVFNNQEDISKLASCIRDSL